MRKIIKLMSGIAILVLLLVLPLITLAQPDFGTDYLTGSDLPVTDVRTVAINLINILLGILAFIVFVGIIYGGFMMMTAGGDSSRSEKGGNIVKNFAIGLIVIFLALAITNFIFNILQQAAAP